MSPILPDDFRNQIPQAGASLCGKLIPGLTSFMTNYARYYAWMWDENGNLSDAFAAEVCALGCFGGNAGTCPTVTFSVNVVPGNTELGLIIDGMLMDSGYTYNIYRSTTDLAVDSGSWGAAIAGPLTTTGSRITYTDTGLVNGTQYFYRVSVQKGGCDIFYGLFNGTPALCRNLNLTLSVAVTGNTGELRIKLTEPNARLTGTTPIKLYQSTDSSLIGTLVFDGTVADHSCTDEHGNQAFCHTITGLDEGTTYYFTVKSQQDVSCTEYVVQASGRPTATFLTAPTLTKIATGHYRWNGIAGADRYCVYRRNPANQTNFTVFRCYASNVRDLYITQVDWPCNYPGDEGNDCNAQYQFYVTAKITDTNVESRPSNALTFQRQWPR